MSTTARHVGQALVSVSTLVALAVSFVDGSAAARTSTGAGQILSAGTNHTCAHTPDGAGPCWGNTGFGQASNQHGLVEWNGSPVPQEPEPTDMPPEPTEQLPEPTDMPLEPTEQSPEPTDMPPEPEPEPSVLPGPTAPPEGCCA